MAGLDELRAQARALREEENEQGSSSSFNHPLEDFLRELNEDECAMFEEIQHRAEEKKRWLGRFEKMMSEITSGNNEEARALFDGLCCDICNI